MPNNQIVVTGAGGFIGFHLVKKLSSIGFNILAIDSLKPAYGGSLSEFRWKELASFKNVIQKQIDLSTVSKTELLSIFGTPKAIYHLAAFPGVRQSEINRGAYHLNNIVVTKNILDACKGLRIDKLFLASSSSIYGDFGSTKPVEESDATGTNLKSFYAETKWQNELDAVQFSSSSNFPIIATRFFTVYGPYGRPDMAYWKFAQKIEKREYIDLYGDDGGSRNYTFIDDVTEVLLSLLSAQFSTGFTALNIASGKPVTAKVFAEKIAGALGESIPGFKSIERPKADIEKTWANTDLLNRIIGDLPQTNLDEGLKKFADWYISLDNDLRAYRSI